MLCSVMFGATRKKKESLLQLSRSVELILKALYLSLENYGFFCQDLCYKEATFYCVKGLSSRLGLTQKKFPQF